MTKKLCQNCGHENEHHQKMIKIGYYLLMFFGIFSIYDRNYNVLLISIMLGIITIQFYSCGGRR